MIFGFGDFAKQKKEELKFNLGLGFEG